MLCRKPRAPGCGVPSTVRACHTTFLRVRVFSVAMCSYMYLLEFDNSVCPIVEPL